MTSKPDATENGTSDTTDATEPTAGTTASDADAETPGFGPAAAIAALLVTVGLLARRSR
ncbi:PGF-CTERM sorting domain-containing protein [Halorussus amylolyticus]|uniref:PGF-CTERM sorting domain-containing protein n=1 Tax=Halorussus amylolyticus TaxID=1126242 RepID=UPI00138ECE86|nr:PGF-CTERM sorting domain-containing protein [Halorussus amylolyticus]